MAKQFGYGSRFGGRFNGRFGGHNNESNETIEVTEDFLDGAKAAKADNKVMLPGLCTSDGSTLAFPSKFVVDEQGVRVHALVEIALSNGKRLNANFPLNNVPVKNNGEFDIDCKVDYMITVLSKRAVFALPAKFGSDNILKNGDFIVSFEKCDFLSAEPTEEWAKHGAKSVMTTVETILERAGIKPERAGGKPEKASK